MSKSIAHLDLHEITHNGRAIDAALEDLLAHAIQKRIQTAEIVPGKGTGQLMKRVKSFWSVKTSRCNINAKNHGRLFVHFGSYINIKCGRKT